MPLVNTGHLWLIGILLVVVLIIWGPSKLPELGSGLGRAMSEFRRVSSDAREELGRMTRPDPAAEPVAVADPAPVAVPEPPLPPAAPPPPPPALAVDQQEAVRG